MGPIFEEKGHPLTCTLLYEQQRLPSVDDIDGLIIMGGPMGVYDEAIYPWLMDEKAFIRNAIDGGKIVLGICLGAQLIADVLGAKVYRNQHREIGWFPVCRAPELRHTIWAEVFPEQIEVFHWHGDTFDIPDGATRIASSEACINQGFILHEKIIALQFHLETTPVSAQALVENCHNELDGTTYVQTKEQILSKDKKYTHCNQLMGKLLNILM